MTTGSDTNTASRPRAGEEAAAAQQALNHSAYAPYPAPMMYNIGPYGQGTRAVPRTFSHKSSKGSRAAATLNTFASTPDPAAVPGGAGPRRDAAPVIDATAHTEKSQILFPNAQWSNAPLCPTPSTVPVVYSSTATQATPPLTVREEIQQEFPRVAPTPVSMIEIDAKLAENDQIISRHKNLRTGLQSTKAAYSSSMSLAAEVSENK